MLESALDVSNTFKIRNNLSGRGMRSVAILGLFIYVAYQSIPFVQSDASIAKALASPEYEEARAIAIKRFAVSGKGVSFFEFPINQLTTVAIEIQAIRLPDSVDAEGVPHLKVRLDQAILLLGLFSILISTLTFLKPQRINIGGAVVEGPFPGPLPSSRLDHPKKLSSLDLFSAEVLEAAGRADGLFGRSTLLLAGGIIMAFVGVAIFYVTLPETKSEDTIAAYLPKVVRPTGVLIFVEAIAWFLLRQYRALVEDYKWFYRLYLKRANYLAAIRLLGSGKTRPEDMFVAASLIGEDYSGRLKSGETTESLEALKRPEDSPITEALHAFSATIAKIKQSKAKDVVEKAST